MSVGNNAALKSVFMVRFPWYYPPNPVISFHSCCLVFPYTDCLETPGKRQTMPITVHCPKGHRLVANDDHAGKTGRCPVCRATVSIPMPHTNYLSETAILGILGSPVPPKNALTDDLDEFAAMAGIPTKVAKLPHDVKLCPSCDREIDTGYHICPHCHTYISALSDF